MRILRLLFRLSCVVYSHESSLHPHVEGCQVCGRDLAITTNHSLGGGLK